MYNVKVTDLNETLGDEVMFEIVLHADTVTEALKKAVQERDYGPLGYATVVVDQ